MSDVDPDRAARTLWQLMILRGVLAVVFGLYALLSPESALLALAFVYGFYALMDGVMAIVLGVRHGRGGHWGWQLVQGAVSLAAGLVALLWPGPTALVLVLLIAVWSVGIGLAGIVEAVKAARQGEPWGFPLWQGGVAILFGVILFRSPEAGALALLWIIGLSTLVLGIVFVLWALRVRRAARAEARLA